MQPPKSEKELLQRVQAIAGLSLQELASDYNLTVPKDWRHDKGWFGQFLEQVLGTTAGTKAMPDFHHLGIELKTIPINVLGKPRESTYVCRVPLTGYTGLSWCDSVVAKKLARVLWVPIEAETNIPLPKRRIGNPLLWSPSQKQQAILQQDWNELMEMVATGQLAQITANQGVALQIRPKGANSRDLCPAIGEEGEPIMTLPRGFYLRARFTHEILQTYYAC